MAYLASHLLRCTQLRSGGHSDGGYLHIRIRPKNCYGTLESRRRRWRIQKIPYLTPAHQCRPTMLQNPGPGNTAAGPRRHARIRYANLQHKSSVHERQSSNKEITQPHLGPLRHRAQIGQWDTHPVRYPPWVSTGNGLRTELIAKRQDNSPFSPLHIDSE